MDRWWAFPRGTHADAVIAGGRDVPERRIHVDVWYLGARGVVVSTPAYVHEGTIISVPLDTVDGERIMQQGVVADCSMRSARSHRTLIVFADLVDPEEYLVCWWGVPVNDEGFTSSPPENDPVSRID